MDNFTIFVIIVFVVAFIFRIWSLYFRSCSYCGGRLKFDSLKDSKGHNISKKITISFRAGPSEVTYTWKCKDCGKEETETKLER